MELLKWSAGALEVDIKPPLFCRRQTFLRSRCHLLSSAPLFVNSANASVLKNVISPSHSLPECQAGSACALRVGQA